MPRLSRSVYGFAAFAAVSVLLLGCSSSTDPDRIDPPPDVGVVDVDLSGMWDLIDVEVIEESVIPGAPASSRLDSPMMPPRAATELRIAAPIALDVDGSDLSRAARDGESTQVTSYVNTVNRRFVFYDRAWQSRPGVADGGSARLQMALGTTGENTLAGFVSFRRGVFLAEPGDVTGGTYRITLGRVATAGR